MTEVDIWSDEYKPEVEQYSVVYWIKSPQDKDPKFMVWLEVDNYGIANIDRAYGFSMKFVPGPMRGEEGQQQWELRREIWEWLSEWEIVQLKAIGPEDSEYFINEEIADQFSRKV